MYKNKLKYLREKSELTGTEVGNIINISKSLYSNYETEYDIMPLKYLIILCDYFKVSLDYIFEFNNIRNYSNYKKDINLKVVSLKLKEFRKDNHLTQEKLAKLLNVVKGTIGNYESARALIATSFLYEICRKYNISADYLLGRIDEPKYIK